MDGRSRPVNSPKLVEHQITANPPEDWVTGAAISPDGKTVAYHDQTGLYLRSVDTGQTRPVSIPPEFRDRIVDLRWFPDGKKLLVPVVTGESYAEGWVISIDGDVPPRLLYRDLFQGSVSPDGRSVVFMGNDGVYIGDVDSRPQRKLVEKSGLEWVFSPVWSPDGQWIAYAYNARRPDGLVSSIKVQRAAGGPAKVVLSAAKLPRSTLICHFGALGSCVNWSTDWRLLFTTGRSDDSSAADYGVWQLPVSRETAEAAAEPKLIAGWNDVGHLSPTTSLDGRRLSFLKMRRWQDVYLSELAADGAMKNTARRFTLDNRGSYPDAWTFDNRAILFSSDRAATRGIFQQGVAEDISQAVVQTPGADLEGAVLTPDRAWILYKEFEHHI